MVALSVWETIYDWVDHISTSASIPLAVGGFWIAIRQINKTKKAAEAAKAAVTETRIDVSRTWVMILLTQLQRTEEDLERAVEAGSAELFVSWSNTWRWQAGQLRGHLQNLDTDHEILKLIQNSVAVVSVAKRNVKPGDSKELQKTTKRALEAVAAVTNELGALIAAYGIGIETRGANG